MMMQMVAADLLKLRKRHGIMIVTGVITIGVVTLLIFIPEILHLYNASKYGPAGGSEAYNRLVTVGGRLFVIAAAIFGTTLGCQDAEAGVLRDMIATGRSRTKIFLSRILADIIFWTVLFVITWAWGMIFIYAFAGASPAPKGGILIHGILWVWGTVLVISVLALCVATLFASRGPAIAIVIGWTIVVENILLQITFLNKYRDGLLVAASDRLSSSPRDVAQLLSTGVRISAAGAFLIYVVWLAVFIGLGIVRTRRLNA